MNNSGVGLNITIHISKNIIFLSSNRLGILIQSKSIKKVGKDAVKKTK